MRGSKRHALELVPGIVVPGLSSFAGLALVGRLGSPHLLGLVSLAWVTATFGSAVIALGPSQVALRSLATGEAALVPSFRTIAARRAAVIAPAVALVGLALYALGRDVGVAIGLGAVWMLTQAAALFEIEAAKGERRFVRASALASIRAVTSWAATVAAVAIAADPTPAIAVLPQVAVSFLVVAAVRPRFARRRDAAAIDKSREIGAPVGRLAVASYCLGYADRYVIQALAGPVPVGVYTLGYQLGEGALEVVSAPVTNALLPRVIAEWSDPERGPDVAFATVRRGAAVILGVSVLAVPAVWAADGLGLLRLVSPSPDLAFVTAVVSVAVGVQGLTRLAYGLLLAQGRPAAANRCFWQVVGVSAVVVPALTQTNGIRGTAVATLVGYGTLALLMVRAARKHEPVACA